MKEMSANSPSIPLLPEGNRIGSLLEHIEYPSDLRRLTPEQLPQVCREIREFIIANCSSNPGHFASSMGAVEIVVALHYVFDTPNDRLVWDVGHQAYAHKILTGRRKLFPSQRTKGGLSGFPNPLESHFDTFIAGHASNSISAALGMAIADMNTPGNENRKTVAVIGDASISGGLAFEGLNNASNHPNNLLIILNDNDMSIDNNVGALHHYLSDLTTSPRYNHWRDKTYNFLKGKGLISDGRKGRITRFNNSLKSLISARQNIFEGLDIRYFGPFDGHDVIKLVKVLREIKDMKGPHILHLRTIKGKGFKEAEKNPTVWHAPGKFNPNTGERLKKAGDGTPLWQDVFGHTLVELAETHDNIMGITAAMPTGTSMTHLFDRFPQRAFDVGISEGHAVTFAGGLASAGKHPFVAIYSSFLQRAYDNIIHDVAIQGLPVTFCIDRAGIVGEDGVTHHGLFDMAYLRCVPNMVVASPSDEATLRNLMLTSVDHPGPFAIRYPRGKAFTPEWRSQMSPIPIGKGRKLTHNNGEVAILTIGPVASDALKASETLAESGIRADVFDMIWLKPLDSNLLREISSSYKAIVTVEDGSVTGGFGSAVNEWLASENINIPLVMAGVPDRWVTQGSVSELKAECGFDSEGIRNKVKDALSKASDN